MIGVARASSRYVCQQCGAVQPKWSGRCEACGAWNSLLEEAAGDPPAGGGRRRGRRLALLPLAGETPPLPRLVSGIAEFDRVAGGGLVPGSALLITGDPGVGKSTLLLEVAAKLSERLPCLYISGEEAIDQLRLRAERLGLLSAPLRLATATDVADITATLGKPAPGEDAPAVVVVDSVQTLAVPDLDAAPGTVSQVRASAQALIRLAKQRGFVLLLVGHVTKEGLTAGPKVLEHMVDALLSVEGERGHQFRILRATKNRFGATDEIGVFEMTDRGLQQVANPSALFLADRAEATAGSCVFAGIEGTRPLLVEIQALIAPGQMGSPRRAVVGCDASRLAMILAVLEARAGLTLASADVFLNVAGGLKVGEPAADLAMAAALSSALLQRPLPADLVAFGEIGLGGEVRAVARPEARLKEAAKLGFAQALMPSRKASTAGAGMHVIEVGHIRDLVAFVRGTRSGGAARKSGHG